jgi:hypothetical protein
LAYFVNIAGIEILFFSTMEPILTGLNKFGYFMAVLPDAVLEAASIP